MSCQNCAEAATKRWHGFTASCERCSVRALAGSLDLWQTQYAGKPTAGYVSALKRVFGERWKEGAQEVKDEYERLKTLQEAT